MTDDHSFTATGHSADHTVTAAPDAAVHRLQAMAGPAAHWVGTDGTAFSPTGPVLANWSVKAAGLLDDLGTGPDLPLVIVTPDRRLHWRALCFALAAWTLSARVVFIAVPGHGADADAAHSTSSHSAAADDGAIDTGLPDAYIALAPEGFEDSWPTVDADEVLVYPEAPLALDVAVEPGFTDAATAVRGYPDQRTLPRVTQIACTVIGSADRDVPERLATLLGALGSDEVSLGEPAA